MAKPSTKVPQNITLSPFQKNSVKVHEVKENLKLNLTNNGNTVKCKYCGCIGRLLEYMHKGGFEFWLECTGSTLGTKHTNLTLITLTIYDHMVNVVELHASYLFISS